MSAPAPAVGPFATQPPTMGPPAVGYLTPESHFVERPAMGPPGGGRPGMGTPAMVPPPQKCRQSSSSALQVVAHSIRPAPSDTSAAMRMEDINELLGQADSHIIDLRRALSVRNGELIECNSRIEEVTGTIRVQEEMLKDNKAIIQKQDHQLATLRTQVSELEQQKKQAGEIAEAHAYKITDMEKQHEAKIKEYDIELELQKDKAREEGSSLAFKVQEMEKQYEAQVKEVEVELEQQKDHVREIINDHAMELEEMEKYCEAKLREHDVEVAQQKDQVRAITDDHAITLEEMKEQHNARIMTRDNRIQYLEDKIKAMRNNHVEMVNMLGDEGHTGHDHLSRRTTVTTFNYLVAACHDSPERRADDISQRSKLAQIVVGDAP